MNLTVTLLTTGKDEAIRSEMLKICHRNVLEMGELLNDLKDYSVLIAGAASIQIEEINVRALGSELEDSFRAVTRAAGMRLDLQIDPDLEVVRSDRKKIRQIIRNLVTNAINYCREKRIPMTVVLAFRSLDQGSWQIAVKDSGIGISPEHLDSIFDEFKRVSQDIKGTGLGLAITKRLVEELKGTIEVFSEIGQRKSICGDNTGDLIIDNLPFMPGTQSDLGVRRFLHVAASGRFGYITLTIEIRLPIQQGHHSGNGHPDKLC